MNQENCIELKASNVLRHAENTPCLRISKLPEVFARGDRDKQSWLGLFEQFFRFDKWNACRVQAAAICDSRLK
jgi:hypothetical protein